MILITFALPDESADFIRRLGAPRRLSGGALPRIAGSICGREVQVWHTGVGEKSARRVVADLLHEPLPELLISSGFAGALDPALRIGDIVIGANYSSASLPPSRRTAVSGKLITRSEAAGAADKAALARTTDGIAVDMETQFIHEACVGAGVPMLSARTISDTAGEDLPIPMGVWLDIDAQRPRVAHLLAWLALHPAAIPRFARFVFGIRMARRRLADFLVAEISE